MKQTISRYDFERAFERLGNFSYHGLDALFNYLEDFEDSTGEEVELDVIALCCEYTEYVDFEHFQNKYYTREQIHNEDCIMNIDDLRDQTEVIMVGTTEGEGFIILNF